MELKAFRMRLKIRRPTVKLCFTVKQHACHGKLSRHICLQGAQLWMPCSPALPEVIITVVSPLCPVTDSICHLRQVTTTCSTAQIGTFHDPFDTYPRPKKPEEVYNLFYSLSFLGKMEIPTSPIWHEGF